MPALPAMLLAEAAGQERMVPIKGDTMAPTFLSGDLAFVVPVNGWDSEGFYAISPVAGAVEIVRCGSAFPGVEVIRDNPAYPRYTVSFEQFTEMVVGKVAGFGRVLDRVLLDRLRS